MIKVHVLCGGNSPEREVSLRSGAAVASALSEAGYDVVQLDPTATNIKEIVACDVVFPVLHGVGGEDGVLQREFENRGIRFAGSGSEASRLCMEKSVHKTLLQKNGLPTPDWALVHEWDLRAHRLAGRPFVLKPYGGGSSVDTFIVRDTASAPWDNMLAALRDRYGEMLLEELINGTELTVGVLGGEVLPVIEIIPPGDGEFDCENKYNGKTQELCPPQNVPATIQRAAQDLALQAHRLAGCRDFTRTDIMADTKGTLWLLETNTIPGMTDQSLFPKMAAAAGKPMPELCSQLVKMALTRPPDQ